MTEQGKRAKLGQAGNMSLILAVVMGGVIMIVITSLQSYLSLRLRLKERVKEAHRLVNVLEDSGKVVRTVFDSSSPQGTLDWSKATIPAACGGLCASLYDTLYGAGNLRFCFENADNLNSPYCFYSSTIQSVAGNYRLDLPFPGESDPREPVKITWMSRLGEKIARLGGGSASPGILERDALAAPPVITHRTDAVGPAPTTCDLAPNTPGCVSCSGQAPGPPANEVGLCVTVAACPKHLKGCPSLTPILSETFFMVPHGYAR